MSEMIELVAKAIRLRDTTDELAMARAAIEAMREPTEAMISVAENVDTANLSRDIYQAMIDEVLK